MKRLILIPLAALMLAACGGTKTVTSTVTTTTTVTAPAGKAQPSPCPAGASFAGCSSVGQPTAPSSLKLLNPDGTPAPIKPKLAPITGAEFPDVSQWQQIVNWPAVKQWQTSHGWAPGGVFKMGEYHFDPFAHNNATKLAALHMWKAGYWFLRAIGCSHEAALIVQAAHLYGVHLVWLDDEVPEARGYVACLLPRVRGAGLLVGVYTGPGTFTGDNVPAGTPLWDAAYNFTGPQFDGLWTRHASCWQFTDGTFAAKTLVPGIGFDDVSVDLHGGECGRLAGAKPPTPPDRFAFYDHVRRHLPHGVIASEHNTMATIARAHCHGQPRRPACKSSKYHLMLLQGRLVNVKNHYHHGSYRWDTARRRHAGMAQQLRKLA